MNAVATKARDRPVTRVAPIVAAVDGSPASAAAVERAVSLAGELDAPIVFVHVRRGPADFLGAPFYQRRLSSAMARGRRVLGEAVASAAAAGETAQGVMLEGSPARRIVELARRRGARLVVVGSRGRTLGRSVARAVARAAGRPVVVAGRRPGMTGAPRDTEELDTKRRQPREHAQEDDR